MNDETKERIKSHLETMKGYELHGGNPSDYKETLVELRESIKKGIFEGTDSKFMEILLDAMWEVNKHISNIDELRISASEEKGIDEIIKVMNVIPTLASMLMGDDKILLLEAIVSKE